MILCDFKGFFASKNVLFLIIITVFFSGTNNTLSGQNKSLDSIFNAFNNYSNLHREVAYCHLNKSTYIKGESIGFSAYVLDKDFKIPSNIAKNLYCVITNSNNEVVKSKLVKVTNGFASNIFKIDSVFTSGNYTFKAYTNWMRNFDEPNGFTESFRVIDPETKITNEKMANTTLDVQFLPEGGHFVDMVRCNVGIVVKNAEGFGVPNITGELFDDNNKSVLAFKTNAFGIGRFQLLPDFSRKYIAKIKYLNKTFEFKIDDIKPKGISINVNSVSKVVAVEFKTNKNTLADIKGKLFMLNIHNGKQQRGIVITFDKERVVKTIKMEELFSGINIFTLFDENKKPVLERMIFNYNGLNIANVGTPTRTKFNDSIRVKVPLKNFSNTAAKSCNISISVLPEYTKSYTRHHNIISYTHLQPYVKGYIENATYYFTDIDVRKKYDLDNLLITQGWSSYDWNNIFNNTVKDNYVFEDGIVLKARQNNKNQRDFVVYPLKHNKRLTVNLPKDEANFTVTNLYPETDEKLGVATLNRKDKLRIPDLFVQFYPSTIPTYYNKLKALQTKVFTFDKITPVSYFENLDLDDLQVLEEVTIKGEKRKEKINRLQRNQFARVDIFDDSKRRMNLTFTGYVNNYIPEYTAYEGGGTIDIFRTVSTSLRTETQRPLIYLDDMLLGDFNFLYGFDMSTIDYVSVNDTGVGEGFQGANGVIKIYTSLDFGKNSNNNSFKQFAFPLAFAESKKFYTPKYKVYGDAFFNDYAVIDWIPNCTIDNAGNLNFTIYNTNTNVKLFIEGINDKGDFLSGVKVLNTSNPD